MSLEEYFGSWLKIIGRTELNKVLSTIGELYKSKPIVPNQQDVFKAFKLCKYEDLRVVILGQDPYPQKGIATGIAFGNKSETIDEELSPSLKVLKESFIDFELPEKYINFVPTLENWGRQGVLLLNSSLTCELNKPGSHTMLWRQFIAKVLENLSLYNPATIYVLLGTTAQSFEPYINKKNNYIIKEKHPSYYARTKQQMPNIFKEIDEITYKINGDKIKWI